ncbi:MAG TPA: hypothetical protein VGX76_14830, partial [Pirellulales bacterium]|nr:hypothetical protein [Pirellulales bacterium]
MPKLRPHVVAASAVGLGCFALLVATSPYVPMVWDEGNAIHRAAGIERWLARFGESWTEPFSKQAIDVDWHYTTQVEGHPAFYGTVIAIGHSFGGRWLAPLDAARLGPIA